MTKATWDAAGRDRRRHERREAKPAVRVTCHKRPGGAEPDVAVGVIDVSETGIRLMVSETLPPGQAVEVTFLPPDATALQTTGNVAWCLDGIADGIFWIGIHFDAPMPTLLQWTRQCNGGGI